MIYGPSHSIRMLLDQAVRYNEERPEPKPESEPQPEFGFSPRIRTFGRAFLCTGCDQPIHEEQGESNHHWFGDDGPFCPTCAQKMHMAHHGRTIRWGRGPSKPLPIQPIIWMIDVPAPSTPVRFPKRTSDGTGKADKDWDVEFHGKFSRMPEPKMVQPKGFTGPVDEIIQRHLSREDELIELVRTQHMELSPLAAQLAANGQAVTRFDTAPDAMEPGNFVYRTTNQQVAYAPDPLELAATSRLIEWEQFKVACGAVSRVRWTVTADGALGIEYLGDRWNELDPVTKKPEYALAQKRAFKAAWIEKHGRMPTVDEVREANAFVKYYGNPALALMSDEEIEAFNRWKREDPTQSMDELGAEDLEEPEEVLGGPEELGLHHVWNFWTKQGEHVVRVAYEPSEAALWPEGNDSTVQWGLSA